MNDRGPMPLLVGSALVAAALCTLMVQGGWLIWIPVLAALAVVAKMWHGVGR